MAASGQTRVDLGTQSKSIDFSALGPTRPVQTGPTLPATCSVGQIFFKSSDLPGRNLYGCVSTNTWAGLSGAAGGGGVQQMGAAVPGNLAVYMDESGTLITDSGVSGSPGVLMTQPIYQAGTPLDCSGLGSDTAVAMNCLLLPTLGAYTLHMELRFTPAIGNWEGGFTLNIDSIGAVPVKDVDCQTDPVPSRFRPGQTFRLTYNGSVFCEVQGGGLTPSAPYWRVGADYYLPFGFLAALPPVTGWSGGNFTGSTFNTSGLGGAVEIRTPSGRSGRALRLQTLPRGTATVLTAAFTGSGIADDALPGGCGIGISDTGLASYGFMQRFKQSGTVLEEGGFSSPSATAFTGTISAAASPIFLRLQVVGTQIISSYSVTGGPGTWVTLSTRTLGAGGMPSTASAWSLMAESSGSAEIACQLLSWNVQ